MNLDNAQGQEDLPASAVERPSSFRAHVPPMDGNCYLFIPEFAHLIHAVLEELPGGDEFNMRLKAAYRSALTAGLWDDQYASTGINVYWAETVTFWSQESLRYATVAYYLQLGNHDAKAANWIKNTLGGATVPSNYKP